MPVSDMMEGAWLGWVGLMVVQDQFRCISEFHCEDPRGLLEGQCVRSPADLSKTLQKGIERRRMFNGHLSQTSLFEFVLFRFILLFG